MFSAILHSASTIIATSAEKVVFACQPGPVFAFVGSPTNKSTSAHQKQFLTVLVYVEYVKKLIVLERRNIPTTWYDWSICCYIKLQIDFGDLVQLLDPLLLKPFVHSKKTNTKILLLSAKPLSNSESKIRYSQKSGMISGDHPMAEIIGKRIASLRKQFCLTQEGLAERITPKPDIAMLQKVSKRYHHPSKPGTQKC